MTTTDTETTTGPACPFCGAAWSAAMLEQYDRFTTASSCACCAGETHPDPSPAVQHPPEDISCTACGRAIYRAMPAATR
ncbi:MULTISPECIES: hypothetical protein [unclassified Sphingomonas]|uniref:hypothetical protein n=1 Tax=unclassified Sphingomonas TaxID=196159 RepID=UPI0006FD4350|nr:MULTISPECIES: hypothetical protein [unclassified Sphingomonas]KRB91995.1 hypothetical protein ASE22_08600 [Sphingomonas sp. Root720]